MTSPPLLTVQLFTALAAEAALQPALHALHARLQQTGIRVVTQSQAAVPVSGEDGPVVLVSLGGEAHDYPGLWTLPLDDRRRWLHFSRAEAITAESLMHCWLAATDPLPAPRSLPVSTLPATPLVSVFTACYRPGQRISRPYRSLLGQTYLPAMGVGHRR
jgi:hypothetical protein